MREHWQPLISLSQHGVQFVVSVPSHTFFWLIDVLVSKFTPKFSALPRGAMRVGWIGRVHTYLNPYSARPFCSICQLNSARPHMVNSELPDDVYEAQRVFKLFFSPSSDSIDIHMLGASQQSSYSNRDITIRILNQTINTNCVTGAR